uniref:Uncharacterized protein n=1 Tax=Nothobranchius korthausae TaxID=1143690 RepID=A0A1A8GAJ1_9TELE
MSLPLLFVCLFPGSASHPPHSTEPGQPVLSTNSPFDQNLNQMELQQEFDALSDPVKRAGGDWMRQVPDPDPDPHPSGKPRPRRKTGLIQTLHLASCKQPITAVSNLHENYALTSNSLHVHVSRKGCT